MRRDEESDECLPKVREVRDDFDSRSRSRSRSRCDDDCCVDCTCACVCAWAGAGRTVDEDDFFGDLAAVEADRSGEDGEDESDFFW